MCCHVDGWQCKLMYSMIEALLGRSTRDGVRRCGPQLASVCPMFTAVNSVSLNSLPLSLLCNFSGQLAQQRTRLGYCQLSGLSVHMEIAEKHTHHFSLILVACAFCCSLVVYPARPSLTLQESERGSSRCYNTLPRQHLRMLPISLFYSDVAQVTGYIRVTSLPGGVVLHIGMLLICMRC